MRQTLQQQVTSFQEVSRALNKPTGRVILAYDEHGWTVTAPDVGLGENEGGRTIEAAFEVALVKLRRFASDEVNRALQVSDASHVAAQRARVATSVLDSLEEKHGG